MSQIKAADVAKLRKMTGAGMMDCKNALVETDGDFDAAIDLLRKKGQKLASKRADREASEGVVLAKTSENNTYGAIIALNCETDFVAKNEDFVKFTQGILDISIENRPANLDELKLMEINGQKIQDEIIYQIGVIGEKLELSYFGSVSGEYVSSYIHSGNMLASIAAFNKGGFDEQVGKDVVMQIAAMNPIAIDKDDVPEDVIAKEIEIGKDRAIEEGKPDELAEKIAKGRLNKFFKESTLLNQQFVKDNKISIKDYLVKTDKELTVTAFRRFTLNV